MKRVLLAAAALTASVALWFSCSTGARSYSTSEAIQFSPHVEAFTSGHISRKSPVYLILAKSADTTAYGGRKLAKAMNIKPDVKGEFYFENEKTIVFRPAGEFDRDKSYRVTADLGALAGATGNDAKFTFGFSTYPLAVRGRMTEFVNSPAKEYTYDISYDLRTPDVEDAATVENFVRISEKAEAKWEHSADGKKHTLTITDIEAGRKPRHITLSADRKAGGERGEIVSTRIPAKGEFGLYDVRYVSEPEKYIEVAFTSLLDGKQDLEGMILMDGHSTSNYHISGNTVRLYPSSASTTVSLKLMEGIKSSDGKKLGEVITHEVETGSDGPNLKLLGDGVIMPSGGSLRLPFRAVYLRGVVVRVIKIPESNIGFFLQSNTLSESYQIKRVGRLITRKTIFLDPHTSDLGNWGTYAVDLGELIDPEPGAIYRVELSYNRDLSVYPCDDDHEEVSQEQIEALDELKMLEELEEFDNGDGYYYYYDEYDWYDYYYGDRDDPCSNSYYYRTTVSRNLLASDLGVIVKGEENNGLLVMVHDINDTEPVQGAEITAYNYQNQVVGKGRTDASGKARFETSGGAPYYVMAASGQQRTYVRVDKGEALSLSTFDVSGEVVRKGLKGFIYGERGVWRPGDTLYVSFMLADRDQILPADHPVVMELFNPLGQQYVRRVATNGSYGLYSFELPTDPDVPTGSWEVKVTVGGVDFTKRIRIESIKPNRLKVDLHFDDEVLPAGKQFAGSLHTEWLQGATARNLKYDIRATVVAAKTSFAKYPNYAFDDARYTFSVEEKAFTSGTTNEKGDARPSGIINIGKNAPGMLTVTFETKVYEESGDFSLDVLRKQLSSYSRYVGIRSPQNEKEYLNTGQEHRFEVITVDRTGETAGDVRVDVEVYKVGWYWWWGSAEERLANYFSNSYNTPVETHSLRTDRSGKGSFNLSFDDDEWGTYYIRVKDGNTGHSAGIMAYFDWPYMQGSRGADGSVAASLLSIKTDKEEYSVGEKIYLTFPSAEGSRALISIENGSRVIGVEQHVCGKGETTIAVKAEEDMMPNAYLHVTLIQPHDNTLNDLPIRLYGVAPVTVTSAGSRLQPVITMKDEISPESKYEITVSEEKGRPMAYTLAIVDEGLLDLTRFQTPDPWKAFNAKEALGVRTWDMYNYVMGAYGGRLEQVFSIGGDDALGGGAKAIVNRFKPVVTFLGPYTLKKGERQKHTLEMPNYNGRVRVMVVAGDGKAYGKTDKSVLVRRPVMLLGTLPRVIGISETMAVPATVFATEKNIGEVKVSIQTSGNMTVEGPTTQTLNFDREDDKQAFFKVRTGGTPGAGRVVLTADSKKGKITYETDIEIRSVDRTVTNVTATTVQAGQEWKGTVEVPGMDGTNNVALEVSTVPPVNLASRLGYLIGYPHGCIEQITSKGFPQLYLHNFATLSGEQQKITGNAVREVISRQRSYQTAEGGFAYWPSGTSTNAWGTIYATHFQLEAEAAGYLVPEGMKTAALNNLRLVARNWKPAENYNMASEITTQSYRLYVLALSGNAETGAMNRLRERSDLSNTARYFLSAAYAQSGRTDTARELMAAVKPIDAYSYGEYDYTYGSPLRDRSVQLMALILTGEDQQAADLSREISRELSGSEWMSTQTTAYALMAMSKFYTRYASGDGMELSYTIGGEKGKMKSSKPMQTEDVLSGASGNHPATLKNSGKSTLFVRWSAEGVPVAGEEVAYESGLRLRVSYTDLNGQPVDVNSLEQGTNFRATVTVANPTSKAYNNIVMTQVFPSGWEILSTRFASAEDTGDTFPAGISYQDIRDDRVYSYIDRFPSGREVTVTINLAAVYEGSFHLPPVYAEAMYDNTVKANTQGGTTEVVR